ncbi:MAG: hypothetical protein P8X86_19970, partial [Desulfofustis sp.]
MTDIIFIQVRFDLMPSWEGDPANNRKLNTITLEVEAFPGMPATAAKLLPLLDNPDSTPSEVENIVK